MMSLIHPEPKQIHAAFTIPRSYVTTYQLLGLRKTPVMSYLVSILRRAGIEFATIPPLEQAKITMVSWDSDVAEICVSWEVEEAIGECACGKDYDEG